MDAHTPITSGCVGSSDEEGEISKDRKIAEVAPTPFLLGPASPPPCPDRNWQRKIGVAGASGGEVDAAEAMTVGGCAAAAAATTPTVTATAGMVVGEGDPAALATVPDCWRQGAPLGIMPLLPQLRHRWTGKRRTPQRSLHSQSRWGGRFIPPTPRKVVVKSWVTGCCHRHSTKAKKANWSKAKKAVGSGQKAAAVHPPDLTQPSSLP